MSWISYVAGILGHLSLYIYQEQQVLSPFRLYEALCFVAQVLLSRSMQLCVSTPGLHN